MSPSRPSGDHKHRLHQPVAHDHPQQVADVARRQRVQVDAAEDRRQRDEDDRPVERGHEHRRGRVGQRDPAVIVAGFGALAVGRPSTGDKPVVRSAGAAAASCSSSDSVKSARPAVSCSTRALRRRLSSRRPVALMDNMIRLPSLGSGWRLTRPRVSSSLSVAPIDCGLICSWRARSAAAAGPPRSSRPRAAVSGKVSCSADRRLPQAPTQQTHADQQRPRHILGLAVHAPHSSA